jgi:Protein of unknown function (DUF4239)
MSDWLVLTLAMCSTIAVVLIIAFVRDRRLSDDYDPGETPDVIEYMTMMIGVIYAIVLGLAIAGVWEARGTAQDTAKAEAFALHEVSERAAGYPKDVRDDLRGEVDAYVKYAVHKEWPVMKDGDGLTPRGDRMLEDVRRQALAYEPETDRENRAYFAIADQFTAAAQARQSRALDAGPTMPGVVWFGLIAGALVSIAMVFTLQIQRSARELVLAGLFTGLIAFLLFLVWVFDSPYVRDIGDATAPFAELFRVAR